MIRFYIMAIKWTLIVALVGYLGNVIAGYPLSFLEAFALAHVVGDLLAGHAAAMKYRRSQQELRRMLESGELNIVTSVEDALKILKEDEEDQEGNNETDDTK